MSLEAQLETLNTNVVALIAALSKNTAPVASAAPSSTPAPNKAQPAAAPKTLPPAAGGTGKERTTTEVAVTKEQVKKILLDVIKAKDNATAVAILKAHGSEAGNLTTLPETNYAAAFQALKAALL